MADKESSFDYHDAEKFVEIFDINSNKAHEISEQLGSILRSSYNNKKELYIAAKSVAINAENSFSDIADKIESDSKSIDPCVSAGFYLNQIMWDINMAKDAEDRLENIDIVDLKQFFADFKYDLDRFARFAGECSYKTKDVYHLY